MELVFQEQKLEYLHRIFCETVTQEQTADVVIPDSLADAERVVEAFGTLLVRSEECMADSVSVSGVVQAGVLFCGESGEVLQVESQIPFSMRRELPGQTEDGHLHCRCVLRSVDARLLNSRKLLIRVCVACTLCVYAPKSCTVYDISEPAPTLQLKRTELPLQMPMGLGEKGFVLNEVLELPAGKPEILHLLKCCYRPQISEQRMVGNKAVFKGAMTVHILYESSDEEIYPYEWSIPFSQYAELERELDECELQTALLMTSAEAEPESQFGTNRLLVSVNVLAQCMATGVQKLSIIEDAFCTDAELTPQWDNWQMQGILDRQTFRETVTAGSEQPAQRVVDAWVWPDEAGKQRLDGRVQIELPMTCNVLYYDADGKLQGRTLRPMLRAETALAENGTCAVTDVDCGEVFCSAGSDGITVRLPVTADVESSAVHSIHAVSGGEITPLSEEAGRKPAVLLRITDSDENVWDIAKSCHAPMQSIAAANDLRDSVVPSGTLLLIPL